MLRDLESMAICVSTQVRRYEYSGLRTFHSPSPNTLRPELSRARVNLLPSSFGRISRQKSTWSVFMRRDRVEWHGSYELTPITFKKLARKHTVCLSGRW
jgi:hypothetical protein